MSEAFTLRQLQETLGIPRGVLTALIGSGFVSPARGDRGEYRFTFQDVILLRTAYELRSAQIPPRRILQSLRRVRAALPEEMPLTGLRITAVGGEVVVRGAGQHYAAESGQLLLDFEVAELGGSVRVFPVSALADDAEERPENWYEAGVRLEEANPELAEGAYRKAIELEPAHADAYANLTALLCDAGRCEEALALCNDAIAHCPNVALLHFNRGVALEALGHIESAIAEYEQCLRLDRTLADAHYNVGRLYHESGRGQDAIRHLSEYRRLHKS